MRGVPAGDFDYESRGHGYAGQRRTDLRIAARVHAALGDARTVLNVGAGAGSYEPEYRYVAAVEPAAAMRAQRPARLAPAIDGPVVILTFDGDALPGFWLAEYVPKLIAAERPRFPAIADIGAVLGGAVSVTEVPIPIDCSDGFIEAYYARPEALLDPVVRRSQSAWGFAAAATAERGIGRLRAALASGEWDARHGHLRTQPEYVGALRLIVAR